MNVTMNEYIMNIVKIIIIMTATTTIINMAFNISTSP